MPSPRTPKKTNKKNNKKLNRNKAAAKKAVKPQKRSVPKPKPRAATISRRARLAQEAKDAEIAEHERIVTAMRKTGEMLATDNFMKQINASVGREANDILKTLVKAPKTDEDIASQLNLKVNDVRRMLNIMNGYSIVRYDVNKDSKGWLIFKWRIDEEKLGEYITGMNVSLAGSDPLLPGNCNDFFICKKCYVDNKIVHPFDSAFEVGFTCDGCGKPLAIMNREQTVALFKETVTSQS